MPPTASASTTPSSVVDNVLRLGAVEAAVSSPPRAASPKPSDTEAVGSPPPKLTKACGSSRGSTSSAAVQVSSPPPKPCTYSMSSNLESLIGGGWSLPPRPRLALFSAWSSQILDQC